MGTAPPHTDWQSLALLRLFLAWVVLCGHLHAFTGYAEGWLAAFHAFGGKAAVMGFLLVSGYSIAASLERNPSQFYARRFLRIYPLYFCAVLLAGLVQLTVSEVEATKMPPIVSPDGRDLKTFVGNFALLQTFVVKPVSYNGPLWSLAIEVFYYALGPLFFRLRTPWLIALVVFSLVCSVLPRRDDLGLIYFVLYKLNALKYLWCWLLGFMMRTRPSAAVYALGLGATATLFMRDDTTEVLSVATYLISLAVVFGATRIRMPAKLHKVSDYLGDLSYPLYLFHFPVFVYVLANLDTQSPWPHLAAALALTVVLFHAVDRFLKPRFIAPWVLSLKWPRSASA